MDEKREMEWIEVVRKMREMSDKYSEEGDHNKALLFNRLSQCLLNGIKRE